MAKPNTSRKRKASTIDDFDREPSQKDSSKTSSGKKDIDWAVECPALPNTAKRRVQDSFLDRDNPGVKALDVQYRITPGDRWSQMRSYSNVKYEDVNFSIGDIIFVNKIEPPPEAPAEDASSQEVLRYQRENFWVARIQDARADSPELVSIRIFYLYWPEELPMGAQHYHGRSELVLSNHADIIDATTISGKAEVSHWDEDEDEDRDLGALYWRQTFNIARSGPRSKGGLSQLRSHCICRKEYNPDDTMFRCQRTACGIWNHVGCLDLHLRNELTARLDTGTLRSYLDRRAADYQKGRGENASLRKSIAVGGANLLNMGKHAMQWIEGRTPEPAINGEAKVGSREGGTTKTTTTAPSSSSSSPPSSSPSSPPPPPPPLPSSSLSSPSKQKIGRVDKTVNSLHIKISNSSAGSNDSTGAVTATVTLPHEDKTWTIELECLKCDSALD